jgi:electron transport complex protein RnfC
MNLTPVEIEHAFDANDLDLLEKLHVKNCMECGACTFICPAKRNLAEKNRLAKVKLTEVKK